MKYDLRLLSQTLQPSKKLKRCQQQLERVTAKLQEVVRVREANGAREGR